MNIISKRMFAVIAIISSFSFPFNFGMELKNQKLTPYEEYFISHIAKIYADECRELESQNINRNKIKKLKSVKKNEWLAFIKQITGNKNAKYRNRFNLAERYYLRINKPSRYNSCNLEPITNEFIEFSEINRADIIRSDKESFIGDDYPINVDFFQLTEGPDFNDPQQSFYQ